jgi:hypothetical protein
MATTDEIIHIYKNAANHKQYIAELEETFTDKYKSLGVKPEINNKIYFKITNRKETHRGFQYNDGLNTDHNPFNPSGCCMGGGLYFTTLENLHMFAHFGDNIRPIIVPSGVPIYDEICREKFHQQCLTPCPTYHFKSKATTLYLLPKIKLGSAESFRLLYNFELGNDNKNNQFAQSRMYLSDDPNSMRLYGGYYAHKYIALPGNSWGTSYSLGKPIEPIPYAKKRKFHPEHKQLIHCKVKELILLQNYDELFALINEKKTLLYWLYYKPTNKFYENRVVSISEMFYIFLKHHDKSFLHYMNDEYFPRQLHLRSLKEQKEITMDYAMDYAIHSITEDMASIIDLNIYKLILKYHGIISGSYALKHRIGAKWTCDDIDVYLPKPSSYCGNVMYTYYLSFVEEVFKSDGNTANSSRCDTGGESRRGDAPNYNMTNIDGIINIYQKNGIKLQFIFVRVDPFEFIKDNFDFDFCKVCFRPEENRFEGGSAAGSGAGRIDQAYMNKISKYNMDDNYSMYRAAKTMDRISKYIERGFTITNLAEFFDCLEKLFDF